MSTPSMSTTDKLSLLRARLAERSASPAEADTAASSGHPKAVLGVVQSQSRMILSPAPSFGPGSHSTGVKRSRSSISPFIARALKQQNIPLDDDAATQLTGASGQNVSPNPREKKMGRKVHSRASEPPSAVHQLQQDAEEEAIPQSSGQTLVDPLQSSSQPNKPTDKRLDALKDAMSSSKPRSSEGSRSRRGSSMGVDSSFVREAIEKGWDATLTTADESPVRIRYVYNGSLPPLKSRTSAVKRERSATPNDSVHLANTTAAGDRTELGSQSLLADASQGSNLSVRYSRRSRSSTLPPPAKGEELLDQAIEPESPGDDPLLLKDTREQVAVLAHSLLAGGDDLEEDEAESSFTQETVERQQRKSRAVGHHSRETSKQPREILSPQEERKPEHERVTHDWTAGADMDESACSESGFYPNDCEDAYDFESAHAPIESTAILRHIEHEEVDAVEEVGSDHKVPLSARDGSSHEAAAASLAPPTPARAATDSKSRETTLDDDSDEEENADESIELVGRSISRDDSRSQERSRSVSIQRQLPADTFEQHSDLDGRELSDDSQGAHSHDAADSLGTEGAAEDATAESGKVALEDQEEVFDSAEQFGESWKDEQADFIDKQELEKAEREMNEAYQDLPEVEQTSEEGQISTGADQELVDEEQEVDGEALHSTAGTRSLNDEDQDQLDAEPAEEDMSTSVDADGAEETSEEVQEHDSEEEEEDSEAEVAAQEQRVADAEEEDEVDTSMESLLVDQSIALAPSRAGSQAPTRPSGFAQSDGSMFRELSTISAERSAMLSRVSATNTIEVSSMNPDAAARAAAILKRYHRYINEGCLTERETSPATLEQMLAREEERLAAAVSAGRETLRAMQPEQTPSTTRIAQLKTPKPPGAFPLTPLASGPAVSTRLPSTKGWTKRDWSTLERALIERIESEAAWRASRDSRTKTNSIKRIDRGHVLAAFCRLQDLIPSQLPLQGDWSDRKIHAKIIVLQKIICRYADDVTPGSLQLDLSRARKPGPPSEMGSDLSRLSSVAPTERSVSVQPQRTEAATVTGIAKAAARISLGNAFARGAHSTPARASAPNLLAAPRPEMADVSTTRASIDPSHLLQARAALSVAPAAKAAPRTLPGGLGEVSMDSVIQEMTSAGAGSSSTTTSHLLERLRKNRLSVTRTEPFRSHQPSALGDITNASANTTSTSIYPQLPGAFRVQTSQGGQSQVRPTPLSAMGAAGLKEAQARSSQLAKNRSEGSWQSPLSLRRQTAARVSTAGSNAALPGANVDDSRSFWNGRP